MTSDKNDLNVGPTCKMLSPCQNGARCKDSCNSEGFVCTCIGLYTGTYCENVKEFASCKAAYDAGYKADGVYLLSNMGYHYCVMSTPSGCTGNGWTLVMKTDGKLETFKYGASYWTTNNMYNQVYSLKKGMAGEEAKFDAFNKLEFTKICLGFKYDGQTKYLEIPVSATSMLSLIQGGYKEQSIGRSKWLSLIPGSQVEPNCNIDGFNVHSKVRIGAVGNNEANCASPGSAVGIGISPIYCSINVTTTGNHACMDGYVVVVTKVAEGFILIQ